MSVPSANDIAFVRELKQVTCADVSATGDDTAWRACVSDDRWDAHMFVVFRHRASDAFEPATFFAAEPQSGSDTYRHIYVFATPDESVHGRTATIMRPEHGRGRHACVMIADSRLDGTRLGHVLRCFMWAVNDLRCTFDDLEHLDVKPVYAEVKEKLATEDPFATLDGMPVAFLKAFVGNAMRSKSMIEARLHRAAHTGLCAALERHLATWSRECDGSRPNLFALFSDAPGPVTAGAFPHTVAYAGGRVHVAMTESEHVERMGHDDDGLCVAFRAAGIDEGVPVGILIAATARTEPTAWTALLNGRPRMVVAGVSAAQVACMAYPIHAVLTAAVNTAGPSGVDHDIHVKTDAMVEYAPSTATLSSVRAMVAERDRASATIARFVQRHLETVKARLWRPDGRLAQCTISRAYELV